VDMFPQTAEIELAAVFVLEPQKTAL
jgi:hypothetical protein